MYNNEYDVTREVTLQPSREWGGEGALGCVLGYGALHRLPAPLSEPVEAPGETMFDGGHFNEKASYYDPQQAGAGAGTGFAPPSGIDTSNFLTPADQLQGTGGGGDFVVPAQMAVGTPPPAGNAPPRSTKKKDRHAHRAPASGIDDYFNEQEQKSRELDRPETTRSKSPLAPPPKAGGGPPKGGPPRADTPKEAAESGGEADAAE